MTDRRRSGDVLLVSGILHAGGSVKVTDREKVNERREEAKFHRHGNRRQEVMSRTTHRNKHTHTPAGREQQSVMGDN